MIKLYRKEIQPCVGNLISILWEQYIYDNGNPLINEWFPENQLEELMPLWEEKLKEKYKEAYDKKYVKLTIKERYVYDGDRLLD